MKRTLLLLLLLICGAMNVVAQPQVRKFTNTFDDGDRYNEVGYVRGSLSQYRWKVEGVDNISSTEGDFWLRHFRYGDGTEDRDCMMYFLFRLIDKKHLVENVESVDLILSNGESLKFYANTIDNVSYITFYLDPYYDLAHKIQYTSSFRKWPIFNRNDPSGNVTDFWHTSELESSKYLFNQLALYDIKQMVINKTITLSPLFRSSELIKPLVAELRPSLTYKSSLPDINNLDRSWTHKKIGVRIEQDSYHGYMGTWDDYISTTTDTKIDFRFSLLPANEGKHAKIDFLALGYYIPDRFSYADKYCPMTIKLSNGVQYQTTKGSLIPTMASQKVNIQARVDEFIDTRNPSVKVAPKTLLQQLAKYDVVEVQVLKHKINLQNANASSAELFDKLCKVMTEKAGNASFYSPTTPAKPAQQQAATSHPANKPTQSATKTTQSATKTYKVGDYYADDTKRGFVFQVSEDGRSGKIISMNQTKLPWYQGTKKAKPRKMGLENEKFGLMNLVKLRHTEGWHEHFPAFAWCADLGNGWYLPSTGELEEIAKQREVLNNAMLRFPGAHDFSGFYWSSNEDAGHEERAWVAIYYGGYSSMLKSDVYNVRAVACFNL